MFDSVRSDRLRLLEQRLDSMEDRHSVAMQEMQSTIAQLAARHNPSPAGYVSQPMPPASTPASQGQWHDSADIVSRGIVSENEWEELYDL
jgi:hypothetical protein